MHKEAYSESSKRALLSELEASGESVNAFSRRKGLGKSTIWNWRKSLKSSSAKSVKANFIELLETSYYELEVGDVVLKIPNTEPASKVAELAKALLC